MRQRNLPDYVSFLSINDLERDFLRGFKDIVPRPLGQGLGFLIKAEVEVQHAYAGFNGVDVETDWGIVKC